MNGQGKNTSFQVIKSKRQFEVDFDIENWLADLLVDYWLTGDGGNDCCPLDSEIIGQKAS